MYVENDLIEGRFKNYRIGKLVDQQYGKKKLQQTLTLDLKIWVDKKSA